MSTISRKHMYKLIEELQTICRTSPEQFIKFSNKINNEYKYVDIYYDYNSKEKFTEIIIHIDVITDI